MLAVVFALEKWHQFAYGRHVPANTYHKPLEAISKKSLDRAPKRLQRMLLRIFAYDIDVRYSPGHTQHLVDVMSRSFIPAGLLKAKILKGWPEEGSKLPSQLTTYYDVRNELGVYDELV